MDWLFADGVAPFSVALLLMFGLGQLQLLVQQILHIVIFYRLEDSL